LGDKAFWAEQGRGAAVLSDEGPIVEVDSFDDELSFVSGKVANDQVEKAGFPAAVAGDASSLFTSPAQLSRLLGNEGLGGILFASRRSPGGLAKPSFLSSS